MVGQMFCWLTLQLATFVLAGASVLILAVAVAFGTQNALAPNLSRIAKTFHFTEAERDLRIGGELS